MNRLPREILEALMAGDDRLELVDSNGGRAAGLSAGDVARAVASLDRHRPDVVVLDAGAASLAGRAGPYAARVVVLGDGGRTVRAFRLESSPAPTGTVSLEDFVAMVRGEVGS